jgi:hypothetical protein
MYVDPSPPFPKFDENPLRGSQVLPWRNGRTNRHEEAPRLFSQLHEIIENSTLFPNNLYFYMALRADSDDFFVHHELIGFYDRDGVSSLRGINDWFL